jgi:hypothetical protein
VVVVVEKRGIGVVVASTVSDDLKVEVATELWVVWGQIARAQARLAAEARAAIVAQAEAGEQVDFARELETSMLAIVAAATSVDGFAAVVADAGVRVPKRPGRAIQVWTLLREGFDVSSKTNEWPRALKDLWVLRSGDAAGGLLHPRTLFGAPVEHPVGAGVPRARALYTVERVDQAVGLMRDIFGTCRGRARASHPELVSRMSGLDGALRALTD